MVKRTKSHRTTKRRRQRGGWNPFLWFENKKEMGGALPPADAPIAETSEQGGVFSGITGFFNSASGKISEGLQGAESFIGEKTNAIHAAATEGVGKLRQQGSDILSPKPDIQEGMPPVEGIQPVEGMSPVEGMQQQNMSPGQQDMAQKGGKCKKMGGIIKCAMKGGKGGSDLTYYAAPVHGLKVAEPKYWINGGSKRRSRKSRKGRKGRKSRKSRKSRKC